MIFRMHAARIPLPEVMEIDCPTTERPPKETIKDMSAVLRLRLILHRLIMFDLRSSQASLSKPMKRISLFIISKRPAASRRYCNHEEVKYARITAIALNPAEIAAVKFSSGVACRLAELALRLRISSVPVRSSYPFLLWFLGFL